MEDNGKTQKDNGKTQMAVIIVVIAAVVLVCLFGPALIQLIFEHRPESDGAWYAEDTLEYYGSVLTLTGTLVLGAVSYWQTKKANEIAEMANARGEEERSRKLEDEERKHRLRLSIRTAAYSSVVGKKDLSSAPVLRLKDYKTWSSAEEAAHKDLIFRDKENKNKETLRPDLLFLEVCNDSDDDVTVGIDKVKQYYPNGTEFEQQAVKFDVQTLKSGETACLIIRGAGKSDEKYQGAWTNSWKLVMRLNVKKGEEAISQDVTVSYWIIDPKHAPQKYVIESVIPERIGKNEPPREADT